jgi:hypothetical protein
MRPGRPCAGGPAKVWFPYGRWCRLRMAQLSFACECDAAVPAPEVNLGR